MSFITTNPNPYLVNVPELQGVIQSATGTTSDAVTFTEYIDTTTNAARFNSIGSYNSGAITVTNDLYLYNANIYVNDSPVIVGNNTINGSLYTAFTVNNIEIARLNSNGFGIFTQTPAAPLHVNGSAIIQSDTGSLRFYNNSNVSTATLTYTQTTSTLSLINTVGDITIDAVAGNVSINTSTDLILSGASLFSGTAGATTGNYLRIKLNGIYYKLALLADV
jgi:hypothetical protein